MSEVTVTGMVLSASPIGEYDRRVVFLTKERGKISAFAKGAQKPNSTFIGVTSPFCFGEFTFYEGKNSYTLKTARITNYFEELRTDVEGAYYGFYFLDLAGYYSREAVEAGDLLKLLYQTLRALLNPRLNNRMVRYIYELKILCISGEAPQVFECISCGEQNKEAIFCVRRGGLVCPDCRRAGDKGRKLSPAALYALQYIVSSPVEKLYTFVVNEEVLEELGDVVGEYVNAYVEKSFKSREILESIVG